MAKINFPNPAGQTPSNTFSPTSTPSSTSNGITYLWDGTKWNTSDYTSSELFVLKTGDQMTGPLLLNGPPTQSLGAATKAYVDANAGGGGEGGTTKANIYGTAKAYLLLKGPEITGTESAPSMDGVYSSKGITGAGKLSVSNYFIDFETGLFSDTDYIVTGLVGYSAATGAYIGYENESIGARTTTRVYFSTAIPAAGAAFSLFNIAVYDNTPAEIIVGSGTVANTNLYGTAKAWGNFSGSSSNGLCTLNSAFRIESLTRTAQGEYTVAFIAGQEMPDANYVIQATPLHDSQGQFVLVKAQRTDGFDIFVDDSSGNLVDPFRLYFSVHDNTAAEVALTSFGDVINYSGAAAWGNVAADTNILGSLNTASVTKSGTGNYNITFETPLPNANYSVVASIITGGLDKATVLQQTATGFQVICMNSSTGTKIDSDFNYAVFATNALPPKGGTGTDSWATVNKQYANGIGTVPERLNLSSVPRTAKGREAQ